MELQQIHSKLDSQCPSDYRINEIIRFAYPYRRVKIKATVNKSPEESIQQVYSTFLRTIKAGYSKEEEIRQFLGLGKEDFILRELYSLRERGYVDLVSGTWLITEQGEDFLKDNNILRILEEEDFEFLIDGVSGEAIEKNFKLYSKKSTEKKLPPKIDLKIKDPELLTGKNEQLLDIYKKQNNNKAYLVDYNKYDIKFDKEEYHDYFLIEYIPTKEKEDDLEPYIEIRNTDKGVSKEKRLSKILEDNYQELIDDFSDSERTSFAKIQQAGDDNVIEEFIEENKKFENTKDTSAPITLSIWETQEKFIKALKTVKSKMLIESPWIKRATLKYIEYIEKALKQGVAFYILYGIESNDEHYRKAKKEVERLKQQYQKFNLIHLPTHFEEQGNRGMTGTHRKLIIKDDEFYIQGSFNFLSFNKEKGQKVANEESILISKNVNQKWETVFNEYKIENNNEKKTVGSRVDGSAV